MYDQHAQLKLKLKLLEKNIKEPLQLFYYLTYYSCFKRIAKVHIFIEIEKTFSAFRAQQFQINLYIKQLHKQVFIQLSYQHTRKTYGNPIFE